MRAAISRRAVAYALVLGGAAATAGCIAGKALTDPATNPSVGFKAPDPHVTLITLAPSLVQGRPGQTVQIQAAPQNGTGNPVASNGVAWSSSDPSVATVSGSGMVTLLANGKATITAVEEGVTASVGAEVDPPQAASLGLAPASVAMQAGQTQQLSATFLDSSGTPVAGPAVSWGSSNTGVATVSASGLITAVAAGAATITANAGALSATSTVTVVSVAPVVVAVNVTPGSSSLLTGHSEQLIGAPVDASGRVVAGATVAWSSSNPGAAPVSSTGTVSGNAPGSATITATSSGHSGTATVSVAVATVATVSVSPGSASLTPGGTVQLTATLRDALGSIIAGSVAWTTSDGSVASVSSGGLVTANGAGSAIITATSNGHTATTAIVVSAPPPVGSYHEPAGMAVQVNTGAMTQIPSSFSIFSPATPSAVGESKGNLGTVPGGTGLRITYAPSLTGGYSPVRFGTGIASAGTGWFYLRMRVRFSPNWTLNGNVGLKFCEPRTQQTGSGSGANENDVIAMHDFATRSTHAWLTGLLQGPNGQARDLFEQPTHNPLADLNDGQWHMIEVVFSPESSPGSGNGGYSGWVDGTLVERYTDVMWLAPGNQVGWPYLMFDPTYGGGNNSPPATMYWDFDQVYVSTK